MNNVYELPWMHLFGERINIFIRMVIYQAQIL